MQSLLKKLIFSFLIATTFLFSFAEYSQVKAQNTWYNQNLTEWYEKVYNENTSPPSEIFGERYTAAQVQWILYSLFANVINIIPGNPDFFSCVIAGGVDSCFTTLPEIYTDIFSYSGPNTSNYKNLASYYMNTVADRSISGVGYVKDVVNKFSPVSVVNAQEGVGFTTAGASILPLWKITRNLSFSLLIVATIVLAFMIMFRVKVNPQTVITIQSTIPKIVVALILITFSYAIAGFIIDLMYVVIALIATIISTGGLSNFSSIELFNDFLYKFSGFGVVWVYWLNLLSASLSAIVSSGNMYIESILFFVFSILVVLPTILWSIKILFITIKNFALLMLTIVTGPLQIMMGVISNKSGFGAWLKQIVMRVSVYPVMVLMLFLSFFFLNQGMTVLPGDVHAPFWPKVNIIPPETWLPPFTGMGAKPSINGSQIVWVLVSYFIFSQITKVAEIVQSFFSGKPFDYGSAIGESLGYAKKAGGAVYEGSGLKSYVDTIRLARQSSQSSQLLRSDSGTGKLAKKIVGGENAGGAISGAQERMYKNAGGASKK